MGSAWKSGNSKVFRSWIKNRERLKKAGLRGSKTAGKLFSDEPPIRAELFSTDQMKGHGVRLASAHRLAPGRMPDQLLMRLFANESVLTETCDRLGAVVAAKHRITPAEEWLLDNFYLVEEQIRTARRHLPKG